MRCVRMSQKYQKEIEEILRQAGELEGPGQSKGSDRNLWRLIRRNVNQSLWDKGWSISPGKVIVVGVSLLLAALIIRPLVSGLVGPVALAGLLLFIVGYGMAFARPKKIEKRWRGQPIDQASDSWWDRFRRKIR